MYITSGTLESSLCGFCPFCCWLLCSFCVRQSHSQNHKDLHLATVSWPPPPQQQHGESPPATMCYIHCSSTLISCALVHPNGTLKHHQIHFINSSKYLISTSVPLNVSQIVPLCFLYIFVGPSTSQCNLSRFMQRLRSLGLFTIVQMIWLDVGDCGPLRCICFCGTTEMNDKWVTLYSVKLSTLTTA